MFQLQGHRFTSEMVLRQLYQHQFWRGGETAHHLFWPGGETDHHLFWPGGETNHHLSQITVETPLNHTQTHTMT